MSAGLDFTCSSSAREVISAVPPQSFNPTAMSRVEGHPVVRIPEQLRLHRALEELDWTGGIDEFNDAARLRNQSAPGPILVTTNGTILAGFGRWRLMVFEGRHEIHCIEYSLSEEESLQFIISHHQPRRGREHLAAVSRLEVPCKNPIAAGQPISMVETESNGVGTCDDRACWKAQSQHERRESSADTAERAARCCDSHRVVIKRYPWTGIDLDASLLRIPHTMHLQPERLHRLHLSRLKGKAPARHRAICTQNLDR
jgi:hypothetical protein